MSQRTLRLRHTTQLRSFVADAGADDGFLADAGEVAFFSEPEAEAPALTLLPGEVAADPGTASTGDILQSGNERYYTGRLVVTLSSLLAPASWLCLDAL